MCSEQGPTMKTIHAVLVAVMVVGAMACGGEEPVDCEACTAEESVGEEEIGEVQQVQDTALCCWCASPPPGCAEEPPPVPATVAVGLRMTNQTGVASAWVGYSIVVRSPEGTVRSDASRWGMMEMDGTTTSILSSPATPFVGDNVTLSVSKDSATTTKTFTALSNVTCSGTLTMHDGTAVPAVTCT